MFTVYSKIGSYRIERMTGNHKVIPGKDSLFPSWENVLKDNLVKGLMNTNVARTNISNPTQYHLQPLIFASCSKWILISSFYLLPDFLEDKGSEGEHEWGIKIKDWLSLSPALDIDLGSDVFIFKKKYIMK